MGHATSCLAEISIGLAWLGLAWRGIAAYCRDKVDNRLLGPVLQETISIEEHRLISVLVDKQAESQTKCGIVWWKLQRVKLGVEWQSNRQCTYYSCDQITKHERVSALWF